jgi:hypothetical protein
MNQHEAVAGYFQGMAELARELAAVPAMMLDQGYSYEDFGSWWFAFKKNGWRYRLSFDGRDRLLTLESDGRAGGGAKSEWLQMASRQIAADTPELPVAEIVKLIRELRRDEKPVA